MNLQSGQNIPLQQSTIRLNLQYPAKSGFKGEPDTCLFMLNAQGKVSGDSDFIFYNNLSSPEGAVRLVFTPRPSRCAYTLDKYVNDKLKIIRAFPVTILVVGNEISLADRKCT